MPRNTVFVKRFIFTEDQIELLRQAHGLRYGKPPKGGTRGLLESFIDNAVDNAYMSADDDVRNIKDNE